MRARATLVAEADDGGVTRLTRVRSEAPLVLRATAGAVYLVGGAAGPLGGDDLTFDITVGPGAVLTVRTAAASVALPGRGPSCVRVTASVGTGGRLEWIPEPVVAARGCRHQMHVSLALAAGATVTWREEIVLGRYAEGPGSIVSGFCADIDGVPLLRHELALGPDHPASAGPAVVGGAGAVGSILLVDPGWGAHRRQPTLLGPTAALLPLVGPSVLVMAVAGSAIGLRRGLDAGVMAARTHTATPLAP